MSKKGTLAVESITDRGTLEQIVDSDSPREVRRVAAERLFADAHVRTHARRRVREAAIRVIEARELLQAVAEHDSDEDLRTLALTRLTDPADLRVCGVCAHANLPLVTTCRCGFDLVNGDLAAAQADCNEARRRGGRNVVVGLILIALGIGGGTSLLPIQLSLFLHLGRHRVDLLFVFAGMALLVQGRRLRAQPWLARA